MRTADIHEAKTHLSRLVEDAAAGEEIVIARAGKPIARLCPLAQPKPKRVFGRLDGKIVVPDNFDRLYEEEIREFFKKAVDAQQPPWPVFSRPSTSSFGASGALRRGF